MTEFLTINNSEAINYYVHISLGWHVDKRMPQI